MIPVRPRSKTPALDWKVFTTRQPTPEELVTFFVPDVNNIGIVCGLISHNLVVVDFDSIEAYDRWIADDMERWLYPSVTTAKGRHVYVRLEDAATLPSNHHFKELSIDIRSSSGFVIAPPSVHPSGAIYTWSMGGVEQIPVLDSWDRLGLPGAEALPPTPLKDVIESGIPYRIRPFVKFGTHEGNRDNRAFWAACVCAEQGVPPHQAVAYIAQGLAASHPDRDPVQWATEKVKSAYKFKGRL